MRLNYKKLKKNIPNKIRTAPRKKYDVLWMMEKELTSNGNLVSGRTYNDTREIVLNTEQSEKESVLSFFHEFIHALSNDHYINLTEPQVIALEKSFPAIRELVLILEGKK